MHFMGSLHHAPEPAPPSTAVSKLHRQNDQHRRSIPQEGGPSVEASRHLFRRSRNRYICRLRDVSDCGENVHRCRVRLSCDLDISQLVSVDHDQEKLRVHHDVPNGDRFDDAVRMLRYGVDHFLHQDRDQCAFRKVTSDDTRFE